MAANTALIEDLLRQYAENPRRVFARLANELRKSGDYDRAIEICRGQIPQQPGYISGHIVLGQSLYDSGRLEEARQTFEAALNLDPENLIALRHLGDIARQHGANDVARGWYRRLLEVDPQNDEVVAQLEAMGDAAGGTPAMGQPAVAEEFSPTVDLEGLSVPPIEGTPSAEAAAPAAPEIEIDEYRLDTAGKPSDGVAEHEPLEIENADAFEPATGAEKAFPDLEQSLEVSGIGPSDAPPKAAEAQAMFGDAVIDETRESGGEPRDAVDAYYPMLDVQATGPSPAAFVTETMAELYLQQGYVQEALDIYRQLAAQNPADDTLRERVKQLEQGSRSSIGIAAISDEVVEAAHKRATTKPKRTIRSFFAKLAMRRVVEREEAAPPDEPPGDDEQEPDERFGAARVNEPPVAPPAPMERRRAAPELEEPAWLRSDPEPESPPRGSGDEGGPFALLDESELSSVMPRTPSRGVEPVQRQPASQEDVPWLAGYEPEKNEPPQASAGPQGHTGEMMAIPPSELFPTRSIPTEDENAAATLASVFEPEFAARLTPVRPMPSQQPPDNRSRTPAEGMRPSGATRQAEEELSLDQVFGRTPSSGSPSARSGFTFDQFFDEQKDANREGSQDASSEIELFNTWLDQLKK
ncbi:MAG TPA: tetratricopeptide repeat protein [Gemmatimonadaceae bacterium]|nr:tetratricopeptide repeat protein [Gemmatimonadaceae bacterium]